MTIRGLFLCLTTTAFFFAQSARADDEPPPYPKCSRSPSAKEQAAAQGAFRAGERAFAEGDYARTQSYWEDSFNRDCKQNATLLHLARVYELNGLKLKAADAIDTYLQREPVTTDEAVELLARSKSLRVAAEPSVQPQPPESAPVSVVATATVPEKPAVLAPPEHDSRSKPLAPLVVAISGGAALTTGIVLLVVGANKSADAQSQCWRDENCSLTRSGTARSKADAADLVAKDDAGQRMQLTGGIIAGLGAASLIGGVAWYLLQEERAPTVSVGFSGVSINGAF